jgi:hypothetical protein
MQDRHGGNPEGKAPSRSSPCAVLEASQETQAANLEETPGLPRIAELSPTTQ